MILPLSDYDIFYMRLRAIEDGQVKKEKKDFNNIRSYGICTKKKRIIAKSTNTILAFLEEIENILKETHNEKHEGARTTYQKISEVKIKLN